MLPVLYSLQHCPYAMRARLGLLAAKQQVMLRAVTTKNKPEEMLAASPKGTIPVLVLPDGTVIDESLDIMIWALQQNDPDDLLHQDQPDHLKQMLTLIQHNDKVFKPLLESYKKAKRFRQDNELTERQACEVFISELEGRLAQTLSAESFIGEKQGLIDYALLPFVRQFSRVNRAWFITADYPRLRTWLNTMQQKRIYSKAMTKYPFWLDTKQDCLFGEA
jgi:glutathione S-transferase